MAFSKTWLRAAAPLALMAAITFASSRPGHQLPMPTFEFADKLVHAVAFAVLAFLWMWALVRVPRAAATITAIVCVVFGGLDELHQSTVPNRFSDVFDLIADTVGTFLGVASFMIWRGARLPKETHGDHPQLSRQDSQGG